jgi:hypothetical protein
MYTYHSTKTTQWCLKMQPEVVEKLVALREGIPRKDAKEVCHLTSTRAILSVLSSPGAALHAPELRIVLGTFFHLNVSGVACGAGCCRMPRSICCFTS